jgi:predicted  nucleic acid-binding Zn-ribbon protein
VELATEIATLNTKIQQLEREANNEDLTREVAKGLSEIVRLKSKIVDLESQMKHWYKRVFEQSKVQERLRADVDSLQTALDECEQKLEKETARADKLLEAGSRLQAECKHKMADWRKERERETEEKQLLREQLRIETERANKEKAWSSRVLEAGHAVSAKCKQEIERRERAESECLAARKELAKEIEKRKQAESRRQIARAAPKALEPKPYMVILESKVAALRSDLAVQTSREVEAQAALLKARDTAEKRRDHLNDVQKDLNEKNARLERRDTSISTLVAINKGLRERLGRV